MGNNEYPEEIYICCENHGSLVDEIDYGGRQVKVMTEKAYDLGKKHAQADTGDWRNLTKAIADGEPIDWEKLDGRKMRMMHEDGRDIRGYKMCIRYQGKLDEIGGWITDKCISGHRPVEFELAWAGGRGWTLWLDGEIPMRKQTADQLPFGTEFRGKQEGRTLTGVSRYVRVAGNSAQNLDRGLGSANEYARNITVYEVIGMYGQKESE